MSREYTQTFKRPVVLSLCDKTFMALAPVDFTGFVLASDATKNNELQYEFMDISGGVY